MADAAARDAQEAMKVTLAINGGAAVAILTFTSAIVYKGGIGLGDVVLLLFSLALFGFGVVAAAMTGALAYFSNSSYSGGHAWSVKTFEYPYVQDTRQSIRHFRLAKITNWIAVIATAFAVIAFIVGLVVAGRGMIHLTKRTLSPIVCID
jgi:hypothetical protein